MRALLLVREDLYDITGRYEDFWSVRDTKPTNLQGKVSLANSFFATPSPFKVHKIHILLIYYTETWSVFTICTRSETERLINGFFDGYATALAETDAQTL